jgi:hypothetical protein
MAKQSTLSCTGRTTRRLTISVFENKMLDRWFAERRDLLKRNAAQQTALYFSEAHPGMTVVNAYGCVGHLCDSDDIACDVARLLRTDGIIQCLQFDGRTITDRGARAIIDALPSNTTLQFLVFPHHVSQSLRDAASRVGASAAQAAAAATGPSGVVSLL